MTDVVTPSALSRRDVAPPRVDQTPARPLSLRGLALLGFGAATWTVAIAALAVWRHDHFLSHRFDLGNMTQAVWSTSQGRFLETTDGLTGEQVTRLVAHIDPALVLFVPLWFVVPTPESLIVMQAAALATGVYPVVRLALKYVGSPVAAGLLGAWYFAFPWIVWNALNDVHPVTLAIPLLLYAIWFLDEGRLGLFALFAGLALLTGELVGLTVAAVGVWYAVRQRRYRLGGGIALVAASWTVFCLAVLLPAFNDGRENRFYGRFESVGGSPTGLLRTLVTDPGSILAAVTTSADLKYLALVLLPSALLALGQPLLLLVAAPQLSVNVLSDFWSTNQPMFQYTTPAIPAIVVATVLTVGRLPQRLRIVAAGAPLAVSLVVLAATPPVPGGQDFVFARVESSARIDAMREAIDRVPVGVPVTTTNRLGAHLSARRVIHLFPERRRSDWAVLDTRDAWMQVGGEQVDVALFRALLDRFERDPEWHVVFDREDVRVYRRSS